MSVEEPTQIQQEKQGDDLQIALYTSVREEIVKRIEIQHQILSLAIIAPGTILTIGFQTSNA